MFFTSEFDDSLYIEKKILYASTLSRDWENVIKLFEEYPAHYENRITAYEDTAVHVAATDGAKDILIELLDAMEKTNHNATRSALKAKNKHGDTPLHCIVRSRSSRFICQRIVQIDKCLVSDRNCEGETPLFLAALHGHKETFLYLHTIDKNTTLFRRNGGETILHCTIQREYFDLALHITRLYKEENIGLSVDENGITPLHALARKPSAFKSSTRLRWWPKILYHCINVESELDVEDDHPEKRKTLIDKEELPGNYHTCLDFFSFLWKLVRRVNWKEGFRINSERVAEHSTYKNSYFPKNYATYLFRVFQIFNQVYFRAFISFGLPFSNTCLGLMEIKKIKQKDVLCGQIMDEIFEKNLDNVWIDSFIRQKPISSPPGRTSANGAQQKQQGKDKGPEVLLTESLKPKRDPQPDEMDKDMTALLVAAKYGVIELVKRISKHNQGAIRDRTKEGNKNILHVAVENRQPRIFMELMNHDFWGSLIEAVDVNGNNVLHLAARVSTNKLWQILGAALQMQWEIKWYQFVKNLVPQHLNLQTNKDGITPREVFNVSHKELVQDGIHWLKSTSESCSVVAALIAGVSFATSSSFPGGNDDQTGKPILEGHPAFSVFAITSLVALSFSITALVMFLSILTSRQQHKDFRRDLPFKLLLGLSSLFVCIASILVSFCAAYFFVLKDKLSTGIYIIYAATCLPASFYAVAQFPLYLDLMKAILTDVPQPIYKDDDL